MVEPAITLLQRELGVGPVEGALVADALLVTGAVVTLVAGKLGDRYGGKRVLVRLMAVVSAGGLLAGLAPNLPVLLLGHVLQGVMIAEGLSWHWMFVLPAIAISAATLVVARLMPHDPPIPSDNGIDGPEFVAMDQALVDNGGATLFPITARALERRNTMLPTQP